MTDMLPPMLHHAALNLPAIRHGFFGRRGGISQGIYRGLNVGLGSDDDRAAVLENRARAMQALGFEASALTTVHQVHGIDVVTLTEAIPHASAPRADGLVTDRPGLVLGVLAADCAPVLLADGQAGVIGACHAGWKGAVGGMVAATVAAMERLGARADRIIAVVGPCISQASYEVGTDYRDRFVQVEPGFARFFAPGRAADKAQFDLEGFVIETARRAGCFRVEGMHSDTRDNPDGFFSYRRATLNGEPDYGRQLSAIALAAD